MIRVELHDRSNALVKVLSGAKNASYHAMLNQDGSGAFLIHRSDPDALALNILQGGIDGYIVHLLRRSPQAAPGDGFVDRFAFVVEAIDYGLDESEEASGWITVAGRGTLCLLEDRVVYPPGYDGVTQSTMTGQWQIYAGTGAGAIMSGEIDRNNGRFALQLTHTIASATGPTTLKLRFDNLRKLHDYLVLNAPMDAEMVGVDYRSYNRQGTDRAASVTIQLGSQDSLRQFKLQRDSRPVKNYVVAGGTGEGINQILVSALDTPSVTAFRRREGYLAMAQDDTSTQLAADAAGAVRQLKAADVRITILFADSAKTQVYRDFVMGDTTTLAVVLLGYSAAYRVVGIQVADLDAETEEIHLDINDMRQEYLLSLAKSGAVTADSLNVINRMPQGAPFNDSAAYPDNCGPTFPFHFKRFIPSNVLKLNYAKLSFDLQAFRGYEATSAAGTAHNHSHVHTIPSETVNSVASGVGTNHSHTVTIGNVGGGFALSITAAGLWQTPSGSTPGTPSTGVEGAHTHQVSGQTTGGTTSANDATNEAAHNHPMVAGIYESAVATNVTVKVNGVDRTAALGGGTGFTAGQTELEISQWLTIGAWNTVDLTPTGLGRILGDLRITGYIQST